MSFNLITGRKASDHVTSKQFRDIIRAMFGGGTYIPDVNDKLEITQSSTDTITIHSGMLIHHGCVFEIPYGDSVSFTIEEPAEGVNKVYGIYVEWQIENGIESARIACDLLEDCPASTGNMQELDSYDCVTVARVTINGLNVWIDYDEALVEKNEFSSVVDTVISMQDIDAIPDIGAQILLPAGYYVIHGNVAFQTADQAYLSQSRNLQVQICYNDGSGSGVTRIPQSIVRRTAVDGKYARMATTAIGYFPAGEYAVGANCTVPIPNPCRTEIRALKIR